MEFREKIKICADLMREDFGVTFDQANRIIRDLDIEDAVIEYYAEEIEELEKEQRDRWQEEIRLNSDIYGGI